MQRHAAVRATCCQHYPSLDSEQWKRYPLADVTHHLSTSDAHVFVTAQENHCRVEAHSKHSLISCYTSRYGRGNAWNYCYSPQTIHKINIICENMLWATLWYLPEEHKYQVPVPVELFLHPKLSQKCFWTHLSIRCRKIECCTLKEYNNHDGLWCFLPFSGSLKKSTLAEWAEIDICTWHFSYPQLRWERERLAGGTGVRL